MLIGESLGHLIQAPKREDRVTVVSVTAVDNIATWTFSHQIEQYFYDPTGFEMSDGNTWLATGGSDASGFQLVVEYTGTPLVQWRILNPPLGLEFVGGILMKAPQSGLVTS